MPNVRALETQGLAHGVGMGAVAIMPGGADVAKDMSRALQAEIEKER